jgi:hypothetical protein
MAWQSHFPDRLNQAMALMLGLVLGLGEEKSQEPGTGIYPRSVSGLWQRICIIEVVVGSASTGVA